MEITRSLPIIAGIIGSLSVFQQAYKIYITNKTRDISFISYLLLGLSASIWIIYGFLINDKYLILGSMIIIPPTMYIIYKKLQHTITLE
tara:strand:+ start:1187 stop:1453 length:267 start_codon:yes stop_codon:yes gene_type:complete